MYTELKRLRTVAIANIEARARRRAWIRALSAVGASCLGASLGLMVLGYVFSETLWIL